MSEGWFFVAAAERARRGGAAPRVVGRCAARLGRRRSRTGAAAGAEPAAASATAAGLVDLGGGVTKRRPDLVDLDLEDGALLAFARLEGTLLEPAAHDHSCSPGQAFGHILGGFPPDVAAQK